MYSIVCLSTSIHPRRYGLVDQRGNVRATGDFGRIHDMKRALQTLLSPRS